MRRIVIVGPPGPGKSTLARQLAPILGIEASHLDRLYWQPGWVARLWTEFAAKQRALVGAERWLIDGNDPATVDLRLAEADTIIFLDLPRHLCLWGVIARRLSARRTTGSCPTGRGDGWGAGPRL